MTSLQVANPPMGTSDSEQYVNLPSRLAMSSNNRTSYDGGQTENNPSVSHCMYAEREISFEHFWCCLQYELCKCQINLINVRTNFFL